MERLDEVKLLTRGAHRNFAQGCCVMEAVSYVAGEPWSDSPECVSPTIAKFLREWNDDLHKNRTRLLKPLIPVIIGTRNDHLENRRAKMIMDWLVQDQAVGCLLLAGLNEAAAVLANDYNRRVISDVGAIAITTWSSGPPSAAALHDSHRFLKYSGAEAALYVFSNPRAKSLATNVFWICARAIAIASRNGTSLDSTLATIQTSVQDLVKHMSALS
jgi:hypothetical protein